MAAILIKPDIASDLRYTGTLEDGKTYYRKVEIFDWVGDIPVGKAHILGIDVCACFDESRNKWVADRLMREVG